jgi:hypothetical protein
MVRLIGLEVQSLKPRTPDHLRGGIICQTSFFICQTSFFEIIEISEDYSLPPDINPRQPFLSWLMPREPFIPDTLFVRRP